jgi:hypothetical protein
MPLGSTIAALLTAMAAGTQQPNILMIVWDDLGIESADTTIEVPSTNPPQLASLMLSEPCCLGDGNRDRRVDVADLLAVIQQWTDDCDGSTPFPPTETQQAAMGPGWNIPWYTEAPMECLLQTP